MPHRVILLCLFLSAAAGAVTSPVQDGTVLARYEKALAEFNADRPRLARRHFEDLLGVPELPADLRDNCHYWLGETWYSEHQWLDALVCFHKVLEQAGSNKEEDARLKMALCWQNLEEPGRACEEARALVARFPGSEAAPRARRLLERCRPRD